MAEQSLKDKTIKGTTWSAVDSFLSQGVSFVVGLVLARLLSPEEYGLIGIIAIFTTVMLGIVDSGFSNALIRKKEIANEEYCTLFYFNLTISIVLYGFLYLGAPWIALFFERPQLVALTRAMGLLLIFQALSIVQYTILSRKIDFKTKTKANVISAIISGIVGIVMACSGYGVWSLVSQQLIRQLTYSVFLWLFNDWRPNLEFSFNCLNYMWGFGWKILISGLLNNIWNQLYKTVVGKFYSPYTLGQYSRSYEYAGIFSSNLTSIVQRVSYPVLSQVQDNTELRCQCHAAEQLLQQQSSEPLLYCLIGPQWHEASAYLPFICVSMSLYPLHAINLNMLQIQGRTDIFLLLEIIKKIIAIGPICLGIFLNIYWMLIGSFISGLIAFFLNSYYTGNRLGYSSWMQLKDVAPSYGIGFLVALSVFFLKYLPFSYWIILPAQISVGIIVFFVVCKVARIQEFNELKDFFYVPLSKMKDIYKINKE